MDRKGFTLIETIIYIAIIGGILVTFVNFGFNISDARDKTFVTEETQHNSRTAMEFITREIRSANSVDLINSVFNTDPGILYLNMSNSSTNPTIISLSSDDGRLQVKRGANATSTITSEKVIVSNLVFTNLSVSSTKENVGVNLQVEYATSTDINFFARQNLSFSASTRE